MEQLKLTIVGLGNLGSILSYFTVLKSIDHMVNVNKIDLIDYDVLSESDNPYGNIILDDFKNYIGYPKVYIMKHYLEKMQTKKYENLNNYIEINSISQKWDDVRLNYINNQNNILIDCRDDTSQDSIFDYKLSSEGTYGKIISNPIDKEGTQVNYTLSKSRYYTSLFVIRFLEELFSETLIKNNMEETFLINLNTIY